MTPRRLLIAAAAFTLAAATFGPVASVGAVTYRPPLHYATGNGPLAVATGELNGDSYQDLVVANQHSESVSVLLNNGAGGFGVATAYPAGLSPHGLVLAKLDPGDRLDAAVTNRTMGTVSVLQNTNDSSGGFIAPKVYVVGNDPYAVAAADVNQDGSQDLLVANRGSGSVSVLLNDGVAQFGTAIDYDVGVSPSSLATGNFDGDAFPDLAVANTYSRDVSILLNNGDGTFAEAPSAVVGAEPQTVVSGDFNRDGRVDLAVALGYSGKVAVALGNGAGGFASPGPKTTYAIGADASGLVAADLDGEKGLDLVASDTLTDRLVLLTNDGAGTFAIDPSAINVGQDPRFIAVADVVADGAPDLVASEFSLDRLTVVPGSAYPETTITSHPSASSHTHSARFSFTSSEPGSTFACKTDAGSWAPCTSDVVFPFMSLSDGTHTFSVRATDTDSFTDPTPATWTWTVSTIPEGRWPTCTVRSTYCVQSFTINGTDMMTDPGWRMWAEFLDQDNGVNSFRWWVDKWSVDHWGPPDSENYAVSFTINSGDMEPAFSQAIAKDLQISTGGDAVSGYLTTVTGSPATINWKFSTVGGNCSAGDCGGLTTQADTVSTGLTGYTQDLATWGGDKDRFSGMWYGTNAQYSGLPQFEGGATPHWLLQLGSPHLNLNGTPSVGFYGAYVSPSMLAAMRLTQARAAAAGLRITRSDGVDVTPLGAAVMTTPDGGVYLRVPALTFSTPTLTFSEGSGDQVALKPDAPLSVQTTPLNGAALVGFDAPFFDGGAPIDGYDVRCINGGTTETVSAPPTLSVQVTDLDNGLTWGCSVRAVNQSGTGPWSYEVPVTPDSGAPAIDTTPPETTLDSAPAALEGSRSATFAFSSDEAPPAFQCRLDAGSWTACASPQTYHGLADGSHTVDIAAIDLAANVDPSPVSHTWTIDATAPDTTIGSGPSGTTGSTDASFTFSGTDGGGSGIAAYRCKIDSDLWASCSSPASYSGLGDGSHTFRVKAEDAAGNLDPSPSMRTWSIDTSARVDALVKGPKDSSFVGDNVYDGAGVGQTRSLVTKPKTTVTVTVQVQNDALITDSFTLSAAKMTGGVKASYLLGTTNITASVTGVGYDLGSLTPGATSSVTVKIKVGKTAKGTRSLLVAAASQTDPSVTDAVGVRLKIKS